MHVVRLAGGRRSHYTPFPPLKIRIYFQFSIVAVANLLSENIQSFLPSPLTTHRSEMMV